MNNAELITIEDLKKIMIDSVLTNDLVDKYTKEKVEKNDSDLEKHLLTALINEDSQIGEDLSKIGFDYENVGILLNKKDEEDTLLGFRTLSNGFSFLGAWAGGDWEHPVFFIIYHDGVMLRAYIPEEGNVYNHFTQEAFGNNEEEDLECLKDLNSDDNFFDEDEFEEEDIFDLSMLEENGIDFDWDKIERDIINQMCIIILPKKLLVLMKNRYN